MARPTADEGIVSHEVHPGPLVRTLHDEKRLMCHGTKSLLHLSVRFQHSDERQVAVFVVVIQSIPYDELVRDFKGVVVRNEWNLRSRPLPQEHGRRDAPRARLPQTLDDSLDRAARVKNV